MVKRKSKYTRCKKCKELVMDADNCANCAAYEGRTFPNHRAVGYGRKGSPTLDIQEGNDEGRG